jgi:Ca-activated chloride channel homolog
MPKQEITMRSIPLMLSLLLSLVLLACGPQPVVRHPPVLVTPPTRIVKRAPPPLRITTRLNNRFVKAGAPAEVIARVRISTAPNLSVHRAPVNLGLVVDTSGSMAGAAISHARKAALAMVKALRAGDRIAIVVFNSESRVLVPSTVIDGETRAHITAQIATMVARGTTDMAGGLSRGIAQVRRVMRPGTINRVVLLSDGNPNDPRRIQNLARYAQRSTITITALGLGLDYNETLLGAIARLSGGTFHFIKDPAKVAGVFRDEVIRMRKVVAQQLSLRILPGPGITIRRVYGRALRRHGRYATVPLGVLRVGEHRDVLIRLSVPPRREGATIELMDGLITYVAKTRSRGIHTQHKLYLSAATTLDPDKLKAGHHRGFDLSLARAEAAQGTVDAIALARSRRLKEAITLLDRALTAARLAAQKFKDDKLTTQVAQMVKLRAALPSLVPKVMRQVWRRHLRRNRGPGRQVRPKHPGRPGTAPAPAATIRKAHSTATKVLSR